MNDGTHPEADAPAKSRRTATEATILAAFEDLLASDGLEGLGVNAIAAQAGVGKPLIYRYFGGFDGLVAAWATANGFWDDDQGLLDALADAPPGADQLSILCEYLISQATRMRAKPVVLKAKISELLGETSLTPGLKQSRARAGAHHNALYEEGGLFGDPDVVALLIVMHAATHYLAMRSATTSNFNGLQLNQDDGWDAAMGMVRKVFKDAVAAQRVGGRDVA